MFSLKGLIPICFGALSFNMPSKELNKLKTYSPFSNRLLVINCAYKRLSFTIEIELAV